MQQQQQQQQGVQSQPLEYAQKLLTAQLQLRKRLALERLRMAEQKYISIYDRILDMQQDQENQEQIKVLQTQLNTLEPLLPTKRIAEIRRLREYEYNLRVKNAKAGLQGKPTKTVPNLQQEKLNELQADLNARNKEIEDLRNDLAANKQRMKKIEEDGKTARQENLRQIGEEKAQIQLTIDHQKTELEKAEKDKNKQEQAIFELTQELSVANTTIVELLAEKEAAENLKQESQQTLQNIQEKFENTTQTVTSQAQTIQQQAQTIEQLNTDIRAQQEAQARLNTELMTIKNDMEKRAESVKTANQTAGELSAKISTLNEQLKTSKSAEEYAKITQNLSNLQQTLKETTEKKDESERQLKKLQQDTAALQKAQTDFDSAIKKLEGEKKKASDSLERERREHELTKGELSSLKSTLSQQKSESEQAKSKVLELESQQKTLNKRAEETEGRIKSVTEQLQGVQRELSKANEELGKAKGTQVDQSKLTAEINNLKTQADKLKEESEKLKQENSQYKSKADEKQNEIKKLQADIDVIKQKHEALLIQETNLKDALSKAKTEEQKVAGLQQSIAQLQKELEDKKGKDTQAVSDLQQQLTSAQVLLQKAQQAESTADKEARRLQQTVDQLTTKIAQETAEKQTVQQTLSSLQQRQAEWAQLTEDNYKKAAEKYISEQLTAYRQQIQEMTQAQKRGQQEFETLKTTTDEITRAKTTAEQEKTRLQQLIAQLEKELEDKKGKDTQAVSDLRQQLTGAQQALQNATEAELKAKGDLSALQQTLIQLQGQIAKETTAKQTAEQNLLSLQQNQATWAQLTESSYKEAAEKYITDKLAEASAKVNDMERKQKDYESQIQALQSAAASAVQSKQNVDAEVSSLKANITELTNKLLDYEKEARNVINEYKQRIEKASEEVKTAKRRQTEAENILEQEKKGWEKAKAEYIKQNNIQKRTLALYENTLDSLDAIISGETTRKAPEIYTQQSLTELKGRLRARLTQLQKKTTEMSAQRVSDNQLLASVIKEWILALKNNIEVQPNGRAYEPVVQNLSSQLARINTLFSDPSQNQSQLQRFLLDLMKEVQTETNNISTDLALAPIAREVTNVTTQVKNMIYWGDEMARRLQERGTSQTTSEQKFVSKFNLWKANMNATIARTSAPGYSSVQQLSLLTSQLMRGLEKTGWLELMHQAYVDCLQTLPPRERTVVKY